MKNMENGSHLPPPKLDLEAYISNYIGGSHHYGQYSKLLESYADVNATIGRTRYERLLIIGMSPTYLARDALKAAIGEAKAGIDIVRYENAVELLKQLDPEDPACRLDEKWIEATKNRVKAETDRLELELRGYKNNLIKESIRMGKEELGAHYHAIGDLTAAKSAYSGMRDYCTTPKHILDLCLKLIVVGVEQNNWISVNTNVMKIKTLQRSPEEEASIQPILATSIGLAHLASGHFREAALSFLSANPGLGSRFNQVISANDVAVYGGLCALASMDRTELQTKVLDSQQFRPYLELEPHIRRAIAYFCNSKYSQCLETLEGYRTDYLMDLYLQRHLQGLYGRVRSKSIVQFFIPFSKVTIASMAEAFTTTETKMENELVEMIQAGELEARIDTVRRLLVVHETDLRANVHEEAVKMAGDYNFEARLRLFQMNVIAAGLEVRVPKKGESIVGGNNSSFANPDVFGSGASGPGGSRSGLRSAGRP